MKWFMFLISFGLGLLMATFCNGQCSSARAYPTMTSQFIQPASTFPMHTQSVHLPTTQIQGQPILAQTHPSHSTIMATQRHTGSLEAKRPAIATKPKQTAKRPGEIKSVENGSMLAIAVDTGKWRRGSAILRVNGMAMLIEPESWNGRTVEVRLPRLLIENPADAEMFIAANPENLLEKLAFKIQP